MSELQPLGGKIWTKEFKIMAGFVVIAAILLATRFFFGLGAVTNLSDGYPWGIWIVYDVVTGTAIACGGYAMALLVYIFNKGEYHELVRSALLASLFGYTLAGVSIFIDIGRYWQMYNVFMPWYANVNSIMFEVAFCVALYIFVMWVEFSPAIFEKLENRIGLKFTRRIMFVFIALGVLLPTMHQSSLGTLMIIAGEKLNALWQTPFLPLLFLMSAITMGFAMVIFESLYSSHALKRPFETDILSKVAGLMPKILLVYMVLRFGDITWRGAWNEAFAFNIQALAFWLENILYLNPIYHMLSESKRHQRRYLLESAVAMILAGSMYRFNTFLIGFDPGLGWHYFPSAAETLVTVGIVVAEIMAYLVFVKRFPVLPKVDQALSKGGI
jgi:Ni/Fe-hydrogenase subunit HybB-like protein